MKALLESIPSDTKLDEVAAILAEKEAIAATSLEYAGFAREARDLRNLLYGQIVHPKEDNKNPAILLRIGTFLTYYVSENRSRYLDDSLLFEFNRYLYDTNPQVTIERLKTLGIRYVLMDLNAATIDRDPARNLTKRYESLLQTVKDPGFSLITTDSPCLRLALEEKANSYLSIAATNYVSQVTQSGGQVGYIGPEQKMNLCGSVLTKLIWNKSITDTKYSYFKRLSDAVWSRAPRSEEEVFQLIRPYINRGWFAAFEVK